MGYYAGQDLPDFPLPQTFKTIIRIFQCVQTLEIQIDAGSNYRAYCKRKSKHKQQHDDSVHSWKPLQLNRSCKQDNIRCNIAIDFKSQLNFNVQSGRLSDPCSEKWFLRAVPTFCRNWCLWGHQEKRGGKIVQAFCWQRGVQNLEPSEQHNQQKQDGTGEDSEDCTEPKILQEEVYLVIIQRSRVQPV